MVDKIFEFVFSMSPNHKNVINVPPPVLVETVQEVFPPGHI